MEKIRVLFLCTANSSRSQMAEALLRKYGGDKYESYSAGIESKGLNPLTVKVMEEIGIDMGGHFSKPLSEFIGKMDFDYMVTVCANADEKCPSVISGIGQRLHWFFDDPASAEGSEEERMKEFRRIRIQIEEKVKNWLSTQE
jgi:arsenate reductase (thioredoxin)